MAEVQLPFEPALTDGRTARAWMARPPLPPPPFPPSLPSAAAVPRVPPHLLQLLEVLKGSLGDVKSWVDLPEAGLPDQRQAAQS